MIEAAKENMGKIKIETRLIQNTYKKDRNWWN